MKKVIVFLMVFMAWMAFGADIDLSGTWKGETEVPDAPEPDKITLVLKKDNSGYVGKFSDSLGMADEVECEDIELKGNELTMNFIVTNLDGDYVRIYTKATVEGNTMTGYWESEDGNSNTFKLVRE
jgi:hypothetical protein